MLKRFLASLAVLALVALPAIAQVPSANPPYNSDIGSVLSATAANSSKTGASQTNLDKQGVVCVEDWTAQSGSPSDTFSIQSYDAATNSWQTLVTSGNNTATATPATLAVSPGIQTSSLPTGWVSLQMHLPRVWRVIETYNNSGTYNPTISFTVGCNYFR